MKRIPVSNAFFFYGIGILADCYNFGAMLAEAFFAAEVLNASEIQLGFLGASGALGYALACLLAGVISEVAGRRNMCLLSAVGMTAAYIMAPQCTTVTGLCGVSFFRSVMTAFLWPPLMAWMVEISPHGSFPRFLGWYNVAWASGQLMGFGLAGWLFEHYSPAAPFHFAAGLGVFTFFFMLFTTPSEPGLEEPLPHESVPANPVGYIWEGLAMNSVGVLVATLILYMTPKIFGKQMEEAWQGALHVIRVAGQILSFLVMTRLRGWHFRHWPVWMCISGFSAGALLLASSYSLPMYVACFLIIGMSTGASFMLCSYYSLALARVKGVGSGMMETFIGGASLIGPLYGGIVAQAISPRGAVISTTVPLFVMGLYLLKRMSDVRGKSSHEDTNSQRRISL